MLPVGDFGNDDDDGWLSPFFLDDAGSDLLPPISRIRRQICLAKLLRHFPLGGQYPSQPQAMRLADRLGNYSTSFIMPMQLLRSFVIYCPTNFQRIGRTF